MTTTRPAEFVLVARDNPAFVRRPARLIVDRATITSNAAIIRDHLSPSTQLMAVVKADGYGHGAIEVARSALAGGATWLGVATMSEARELRDAGVIVPILVLGPSSPAAAASAAAFSISIGVGDAFQLDRLIELLAEQPPIRPLGVHLKIDTGMRRFGVNPQHAAEIARRISVCPHMSFEGIYSHFAEADAEDTSGMDRQFSFFQSTLREIDRMGIERGIAHMSNSAALLRDRGTDLEMVRAGICLYGIAPSEHVRLFAGMRPALEWLATIQHITEIKVGDRVGYGGTYVATEREHIALLPIGYADGYPRHLSNRGWVTLGSHRFPIRGRVSMDQCTVGIPVDVDVSVGQELTLLGDPATGAPSANELADLTGTIGYEIVSRISRRVPVEYR